MSLSVDLIKKVGPLAYAAGLNASGVKRVYGGCGRVYIEIIGGVRKGSKIAKTFESVGFKMLKRPNSSGVRIYVGYDNATGHEFVKADAIAEVLKENGIGCYVDADGD